MIKQLLRIFGLRVPRMLYWNASIPATDINDETALSYGPFFRGVMTIASDVSQLPLQVFVREEDNEKQRDDKHPVARLLRHRINRYMTRQEFLELIQFHCLVYGNGLAQIVRNKQGEVIQLISLMPWLITYKIEDNQLVYEYKLPDDTSITLQPEDVVHIKGFTFDGLVGVPLYEIAKQSIKQGLSAESLAIAFYENGATLSGILKLPYSLDSDEKIRSLKEQWRQNYQGSKNAGKVAVLEEGADFKPISPSFEESQWIEGRQFQKLEMSHWFLMPPSKIGDKSTYSSLEESNRDYLTSCLNKWLVKLEEELTTKLFINDEAGRYFVEFNRNALIRTSLSDRYNAYTKAIHYGFLSANEVRQLENLPSYPEGNKYYSPVNIWPNDEERPLSQANVEKDIEGTATGG